MLTRLATMQAAVFSWFSARFSDEGGASLVEYALLLALIAVAAITALIFLGHSTSNSLNNIGSNINNA